MWCGNFEYCGTQCEVGLNVHARASHGMCMTEKKVSNVDNDDDEMFTDVGDDWRNRAILGYGCEVPWHVYVFGYKEAADRLVCGIDAGQHGQDMLVFPILFLYRQYLELSIKVQIRECQSLLCIVRPSSPKSTDERVLASQGHDLIGLWKYLQQLVSRVYPTVPASSASEIDRVISAFANLDPRGDEARYPLTTSEQRTLRELSAVNLRRLSEDISRADAAFTQIGGGIDWEVDRRQLAAGEQS